MSSESLVRLVILCLTFIVLCLLILIGLLSKDGSPVVLGSLVTLAGAALGGLSSMLANSGTSNTAKSGGTLKVEQANAETHEAETTDGKAPIEAAIPAATLKTE
jgi:hypothetical protein